MGGNSGGGQKKMRALENEHLRSFSSVVEVDCWQRRGALMPFQAESEFGFQTPHTRAGVLGYRIPTPTPTPSKPVIIPQGFSNP